GFFLPRACRAQRDCLAHPDDGHVGELQGVRRLAADLPVRRAPVPADVAVCGAGAEERLVGGSRVLQSARLAHPYEAEGAASAFSTSGWSVCSRFSRVIGPINLYRMRPSRPTRKLSGTP